MVARIYMVAMFAIAIPFMGFVAYITLVKRKRVVDIGVVLIDRLLSVTTGLVFATAALTMMGLGVWWVFR